MRGEQNTTAFSVKSFQGSPPHARGAGFISECQAGNGGITPACAGSSSRFRDLRISGKDHPRMRGEQLGCILFSQGFQGSPPHARGAATGYGGFTEVAGITPACAGSSMEEADERRFAEDHPRMRGEQSITERTKTLTKGSPPHARGAVMYLLTASGLRRITPACAGSRETENREKNARRDHPRMRGEQLSTVRHPRPERGSPPHARGAAKQMNSNIFYQGITPACAGSSL